MSESYCTFGFDDLHWAAVGRGMTDDERDRFAAMSQADRNDTVRRWAAAVPSVRLDAQTGADGVAYLAFRFDRPPAWARVAWDDPDDAMRTRCDAAVGGDPSADAAACATSDRAGAPAKAARADEPGTRVDASTPPDQDHWVAVAVAQPGPLVPRRTVGVALGATADDARRALEPTATAHATITGRLIDGDTAARRRTAAAVAEHLGCSLHAH